MIGRERILVPFAGPGASTSALSWGQRAIWQSIQADGHSITVGGATPLPPGITLEQAIDITRYLVGRHESLRTRYRFDADGAISQEVFASGETSLDVVDAGDADPAEVARAILAEYQDADFDYEHEWPMRSAVIRAGGQLTHSVVVNLHLAVDAHGVTALMADLTGRDPVTGAPAGPVLGATPREQAQWQQTPAARRQCDASLRHMERVLRAAPARRFSGPAEGVDADYPMLRFRSLATRLAVRMIADRHGMDTSQVLLAVFAVAVSRVSGNPLFACMIAVNNRFRRGFASSVSPLAQVSPCLIDLAGLSLDEVVGRARQAAMSAYKYAYYHPALRLELVSQVNADRGEPVDMSCFFNDRRTDRDFEDPAVPTESELAAEVGRSVRWWDQESEQIHERLYFSVNDAVDAVEFSVSADVRYLPPARLEEFIDSIEAIAVETALSPLQPVGIQPVRQAS